MKKLLLSLTLTAIATTLMAQAPAFPGAEGHGRYTTGGRGGKVIHVTNLNDKGTGSFREAVKGNDKKIVVFDVGGVIALASDVSIGANTTIMGQTAPAPGITLRYYNVNPSGNNIVMRFIRIRRGQEKNINDGADASTARHYTGMILDHCSFSWSIDEVASFYDNNNFTMQWCTIGESLVNPGHSKGAHGYGGIWGGKLASFHHNLLIHHSNRTPRFNGARYNWEGYTSNMLYYEYKWQNAVQAENVDFRNCVIYNCGNGCYGGPGGGKINMVNNYYKTGPAATTSSLTTVTVGASGNAAGYPIYWDMTSRYYLEGNQINSIANAGWNYINYDNGTIVHNGDHYSKDPNHYNGEDTEYYTSNGTDYVCIRLSEPGPTGEVTTHTAAKAYDKVLTYAGASLNLDEVDKRYFNEVKSGTATYSGSITGKKGRIDVVSDVKGYTEANFGTGKREADFDTDKDGIPDAWEKANGLDPNDGSDATKFTLDESEWYSNIEIYCNSLVQDIMLEGNADATDTFKEYYPNYVKEDGTQVEAINAEIAVINNDDVNKSAQGDIAWTLSTGAEETASLDNTIAPSVAETQMTVGSKLTTGTKGINGITYTTFQPAAKISALNNDNLVAFKVVPASGYQFAPTKISFLAARIGTDGGNIDVKWTTDAQTTSIETGLLPNRANEYTDYSKSVNVAPTTGESLLQFFIYNLNDNKQVALAHVTINGFVTDGTTGISTHTVTTISSSPFYNLQGIPVAQPTKKGVYIRDAKKIIIR